MKSDIVKRISGLLLPFVQVFGIYVILFGHLSPGGGFAGGSILGASMILYRFVYGVEASEARFKYRHLMKVVSLALVTYGLIKGYVFIGAFMHWRSGLGPGNPASFLSGGYIMPLNILIGAVVAITFYFIATLFEEGDLENADPRQ